MGRLAVFRVDASVAVGMGHLLRCRTLAAGLADQGWRIGFACCSDALELAPWLRNDGCEIVTMPSEVSLEPDVMRHAWPSGADALVIDHYGRNDSYESACRPWARCVVAIDDVPARRHDADMLLDQTLGRTAGEYRDFVQPETQLAVGGDFILLRPEIRARQRKSADVPAQARRMILTFGGTDTTNLSARALEALSDPRLAKVSACLVLGPGNARYDELQAVAPAHVRIVVNPPDFPEIMANADMALAAAGTTCWELAHLGIPAILVTESPGIVAQSLEAAGAARWLGREADVDAGMMADALTELAGDRAARQAMADAGQRLVDGKGAARAAAMIDELCR